MHITVVTITSRKRWRLLERTIHSAFSEGADQVLVIDNESQEGITTLMNGAFPGRHCTIRLEPNQGSSGAYYYGIKAAVESGAEFLLLLDDDNVLKPGALVSIINTYNSLKAANPSQFFCVTGMRMEQEVLRGEIPEPLFPTNKRFLGFTASHLILKAWKRLPWFRRARLRRTFVPPQEPVRRKLAPFGGMFFHRSLIERFGYPDSRFVLYCDDVEFTHRITEGGGSIWLDPHAQIDDIDSSWHASSSKLSFFETWIELGTDEQVYYELRNKAYLETHDRPRSLRRQINRIVLIPILWYIAARTRKLDRFHLILKAVKDGESGRLVGRTLVRVIDSGLRHCEIDRQVSCEGANRNAER